MSVGIDIGSKSIKVVELAKASDKFALKGAGIISVKDGDISRIEDEVSFTNLANTVKKLVHDAKISSKEVNISLPDSQVFTRTIKFPPLTDAEVESAVKYQAEEMVPIPLKDAIFQHMILERRENTQPPEVLVLLVAAPRILVEKYVKVITLAGLTAVGIEPGSIAISRSLGVPSKTAFIIDFGAKSTNIAVVRNQKLVLSRTIPTAGDAFTRAVSQVLGIDVSQGEEYKRTYGLNADQLEGKVANALMPIFKIVVEEIKKTIQFYQTDEKGNNPDIIVISGGTAGLPGVAPALTKLLGTEVIIGNPFAKVSVDPRISQNLSSYAQLYGTAVGLALKDL